MHRTTFRRGATVGLLALALIPSAAYADDGGTANDAAGTAAAMNDAVATVDAGAATANADVSVPRTAAGLVSVDLAGGNTLALGLPATGAADASGRTKVFDGSAPDSQIGVQPTADGVRALIQLDSPAAPDRYDFQIGGDVASLDPQDDGVVLARNTDGGVIGWIHAPWAVDAKGTPVPTHYEVDGTTLAQVIDQQSGDYAYPIVADPATAPNCVTFSINWLGTATVVNHCGGYQRVKAVRRFDFDTSCHEMAPGSKWSFWTTAGIDRLEKC